ncbi:uncharacterized protein LOC128732075 [Anopheles nili]|uniref:uncharacterized protein LOC128732075 n=1 Tax=Anopheles nili TaxID=185578 RepID=UPI00237C01F4|nr:uncharacterized protein LOC128732075 [Anopheles nili]
MLLKQTNSNTDLASKYPPEVECCNVSAIGETLQENVERTTLVSSENQHEESDSDASSVGDHLVNPEMINLNESFFSSVFQIQPNSTTNAVNVDLIQEDSENDGCILDRNVEYSTTQEDDDRMYQIYTQLSDFNKILSGANIGSTSKAQATKKHNASQESQTRICDVSALLSQTEGIFQMDAVKDDNRDWENVQDEQTEAKNDLEIIVSNKSLQPGRVVDVAQSLRRLEQEKRNKICLSTHQTHLLLLLSHGIEINRILNYCLVEYASHVYDLVANSDLSLPAAIDDSFIKSIVVYYKDVIQLTPSKSSAKNIKIASIGAQLVSRMASSRKMLNLMLLILLRFLSVRSRLVINLDVMPKRPPTAKPTRKAKDQHCGEAFPSKARYGHVPLTTTEILKHKPEMQRWLQLSQLDGADDQVMCEDSIPVKKCRIDVSRTKPKLWKLKSRSDLKANVSDNSKLLKRKPSTNLCDSKNLKTKMSNDKNETNIMQRVPELDLWIECFLENEQRWAVVEAGIGQIDCLEQVIDCIQDPPVYVFAWEADGTIVDVAERYWWKNESKSLKERVDRKWLLKALRRYRPPMVDVAYMREQHEFRQLKFRAPMPTTVARFKNHPSYCLKIHLQKFQAIYPPDAPPLGFIAGEPIYARECVHMLHSREVWLRHAKTIRMHEGPYKIVKSKLRREQIDLELFGYWQTEDYIPPEPVGGIVPRNAFGNIEIFQECMIPKGTVHLKQYGLSHICRKLKIDYAVAVVGFGVHAGGNHPIFDGIVICEEHRERLLDAWERYQEEAIQKKKDKKLNEVLNNWVKLVKGLLVRRRLKNKYNFDGM